MNTPDSRFAELMDRYGPDLSSWPDAQEAGRVRRELLANPAARTARDEAVKLDRALQDYGRSLDLWGPGSTQRVSAAVLARLPARGVNEVSWWLPRIAAGFFLAIVAGGVFDTYVTNTGGEDVVAIASLDTLVYGPGDLDL